MLCADLHTYSLLEEHENTSAVGASRNAGIIFEYLSIYLIMFNLCRLQFSFPIKYVIEIKNNHNFSE